MDAKLVLELFNTEKFQNSVDRPESVKSFVVEGSFGTMEIHDDPDVIAMRPLVSAEGIRDDVFSEFEFSPWRYVSSGPTNNPASFDLWTELQAGDQKMIIGNWPSP